MKYWLIIFITTAQQTVAQSSFYSLRLAEVDSATINLADFRGMKVVVAAVSPARLQSIRPKVFDSLQAAFPKVVFLIIPCEDFEGRQDDILSSINNRPSKRARLFAYAQAKKENKDKQHPLFRWLSSVELNGHFDDDIQNGQIFIIDEAGELYAQINNGIPLKSIHELLTQPDVSIR